MVGEHYTGVWVHIDLGRHAVDVADAIHAELKSHIEIARLGGYRDVERRPELQGVLWATFDRFRDVFDPILANQRDGPWHATRVPIERGTVERFEQRFEQHVDAVRKEHELVSAFEAYLRVQGLEVVRHRFDSAMAIGQLADYAHLMSDPVERQAVLLPSRPAPEIEALLGSQAIDAIWREREGFADNAGGALT